jgi:lysophospholipase L1-like esterase
VCREDETPLACEYRASRPSVALIMIGTNDILYQVDSASYRANLEDIVQISIDMGVIPVLSTIPDNLTGPEGSARVLEFNDMIRSVAGEYGVPLWDYWLALQTLPNKGMAADNYHPSFDPAPGTTAIFTPEHLQYGFNVRNLTALMVLDAVWKGAMY